MYSALCMQSMNKQKCIHRVVMYRGMNPAKICSSHSPLPLQKVNYETLQLNTYTQIFIL